MAKTYHSPNARIPYRKGVFQEASEYNSLAILEMHKKDRDYALKKVININTGEEASKLVLSYVTNNLAIGNGTGINQWQYSIVDLHGRIGILKYKGVEIAVFVKRQLIPHRISPDTPISEVKLENEDDAWMRVDLSGLSARQSKRPTLELIRKLERKVEEQTQLINMQKGTIDQLEAQVKRYEKKNKGKTKGSSKDNKASKGRHSKTKSRSRKGRR